MQIHQLKAELHGMGCHPDLGGNADLVWLRGGFPRSTLVATDADVAQWLRSYLRTLAARDLREFGMSLTRSRSFCWAICLG